MSSSESIAPIAPRPAAEVGTWEAEADVVVVGYGCAGAAAAIGALESGSSSVTVLERAGAGGGASAMAGGEIYLGGGTPVQKACGFDDTPQAMYDFLMAATGPSPNEEKIAIYTDRSVEHFHWLVECGVVFKPSFYPTPCWEPPTDDGLVFTGGENAWPFSEVAPPAPRGHVPQIQNKRLMERSGGWELMRHLTATAERLGAWIRSDCRVTHLVVDGGAVVGVVARSFGTELAVRARHGVVLAGGGFASNPGMVARHVPALAGQMVLGTDGDDGTAIRLGQGAGAMVAHLDAAEAALPSNPPLVYPSLLVNQFGQRFINEDTYCGRVGQMALFHQQGRCSLVLDERIFESIPEEDRWGARPTYVAATVAELEAEMGLAEGSLQSTVDVYNRHAARGEDPVFHKRSEFVRPLESPFGAIPLTGPYAVFTLGGLVTTVDGEVVGAAGEPIPGLFAAGRCTWGIPSWGYASGTSLGDGTFFGRRAGLKAGAAG
ncbi:MAG TPA: FAD-dependent oxidoreductase [Acidimicrobiales bacterium]|nr:FAD-dependent oxidoreductase [Acidimicrobiales bacterium]